MVKEIPLATPQSLSFAPTALGQTSSDSPQTLELENIGNASLSITSTTASTNFNTVAAATSPCGSTLTSGALCNLSASFSPTTVGSPLTGTLTLLDNSLTASQTANLSGVGTQASQAITFTQPSTPVTSGTQATLVATSTSGLAVSFAITGGTGSATLTGINNSTITYTGTGTVQITASQAGNTSFSPAVNVADVVTVIPAGPPGYTYCAPEQGTCNISSLSSVAYGANGNFYYGDFSASVSCSNGVFGDPIYGTVKACFYMAESPTTALGPPGYTYCAPENGTCNITSYSSVAFGANGSFNYSNFSAPVSCNDSVFGDPLYGTLKNCFYQTQGPPPPTGPAGYTYCAAENGTCNISALASVAYGANGSFYYGDFSAPVSCSNGVFTDPIYGTVKACFYQLQAPINLLGPPGYTFCAAEQGTCNLSSTSSVAFGANGSFNYGIYNSPVSCSNSVFGDPLFGILKGCYYQTVSAPSSQQTLHEHP